MSFPYIKYLCGLMIFLFLLLYQGNTFSTPSKLSETELKEHYKWAREYFEIRLGWFSNAEKLMKLAENASEFSNALAFYHLGSALSLLKQSDFTDKSKYKLTDEVRQVNTEFFKKTEEKYPIAPKYIEEINSKMDDVRHKASEEAKLSLAECMLYSMSFDRQTFDDQDYKNMKKVLEIYEKSGEMEDASKLRNDLYECAFDRIEPVKKLWEISDLAVILHDSGQKEKALKLASKCFSEFQKEENREWNSLDAISLIKFYSHVNDLKMIEKVIDTIVTAIDPDDINKTYLEISKSLASDSRFELAVKTIQNIKDDKLVVDGYKYILSKLDLILSRQLSSSILDKILAGSDKIGLPSSRNALIADLSEKYFDVGNPEKAFSILQDTYKIGDMTNLPLMNVNDLGYLVPSLIHINRQDIAKPLIDASFQKITDTIKNKEFYSAYLLIFSGFYFELDEIEKARGLMNSIPKQDDDSDQKSMAPPKGVDYRIFKHACGFIVKNESPETIVGKFRFLKNDLFDRYFNEGKLSDAIGLSQNDSKVSEDLYIKVFDAYIAKGDLEQAYWVSDRLKKSDSIFDQYNIMPKLAAGYMSKGDYEDAEGFLLRDYTGVMNPNIIISFLTLLSKIEPLKSVKHKNLAELLTGLIDEYAFYQDLKIRWNYNTLKNTSKILDIAYGANDDILSTAYFVSPNIEYPYIKLNLEIAEAYFKTGNPDKANEIVMDSLKTSIIQNVSWYNSDNLLDIAETCLEIEKPELAWEIASEVKRHIEEKPQTYLSYGYLCRILNIYFRCGDTAKPDQIMADLYANENLYQNECNNANYGIVKIFWSLNKGEYESAIDDLDKTDFWVDGFNSADYTIEIMLSRKETQWATQFADKIPMMYNRLKYLSIIIDNIRQKEQDFNVNIIFKNTINESIASNDVKSLIEIARLIYQYNDKTGAVQCLNLALKAASNSKEKDEMEKQVKWAYVELGMFDKIGELPVFSSDHRKQLSEKAILIRGYIRSKMIEKAEETLKTINNESRNQAAIVILANDFLENGFKDKAFDMITNVANIKSEYSMYEDNWSDGGLKFDGTTQDLILNLASNGRIDLSLKLISYMPDSPSRIHSLIKLNGYIKSNGVSLSDDDLFWMRKIIHKNNYFCKYPLEKVIRNR